MDERTQRALERFMALSAEEQEEVLSLLEMIVPPKPADGDARGDD